LITARNDAEQIMTALHKQLKEYVELTNPAERARMEEAAQKLANAQASDDRELISRCVDELNEISRPFAERIMDHAIHHAVEKGTLEGMS
jgi:molecular chaperone HscA